MSNFILGTVGTIVVAVASFFTLNDTEQVSNNHSLTAEEKCAIYEQVMESFVVSE